VYSTISTCSNSFSSIIYENDFLNHEDPSLSFHEPFNDSPHDIILEEDTLSVQEMYEFYDDLGYEEAVFAKELQAVEYFLELEQSYLETIILQYELDQGYMEAQIADYHDWLDLSLWEMKKTELQLESELQLFADHIMDTNNWLTSQQDDVEAALQHIELEQLNLQNQVEHYENWLEESGEILPSPDDNIISNPYPARQQYDISAADINLEFDSISLHEGNAAMSYSADLMTECIKEDSFLDQFMDFDKWLEHQCVFFAIENLASEDDDGMECEWQNLRTIEIHLRQDMQLATNAFIFYEQGQPPGNIYNRFGGVSVNLVDKDAKEASLKNAPNAAVTLTMAESEPDVCFIGASTKPSWAPYTKCQHLVTQQHKFGTRHEMPDTTSNFPLHNKENDYHCFSANDLGIRIASPQRSSRKAVGPHLSTRSDVDSFLKQHLPASKTTRKELVKATPTVMLMSKRPHTTNFHFVSSTNKENSENGSMAYTYSDTEKLSIRSIDDDMDGANVNNYASNLGKRLLLLLIYCLPHYEDATAYTYVGPVDDNTLTPALIHKVLYFEQESPGISLLTQNVMLSQSSMTGSTFHTGIYHSTAGPDLKFLIALECMPSIKNLCGKSATSRISTELVSLIAISCHSMHIMDGSLFSHIKVDASEECQSTLAIRSMTKETNCLVAEDFIQKWSLIHAYLKYISTEKPPSAVGMNKPKRDIEHNMPGSDDVAETVATLKNTPHATSHFVDLKPDYNFLSGGRTNFPAVTTATNYSTAILGISTKLWAFCPNMHWNLLMQPQPELQQEKKWNHIHDRLQILDLSLFPMFRLPKSPEIREHFISVVHKADIHTMTNQLLQPPTHESNIGPDEQHLCNRSDAYIISHIWGDCHEVIPTTPNSTYLWSHQAWPRRGFTSNPTALHLYLHLPCEQTSTKDSFFNLALLLSSTRKTPMHGMGHELRDEILINMDSSITGSTMLDHESLSQVIYSLAQQSIASDDLAWNNSAPASDPVWYSLSLHIPAGLIASKEGYLPGELFGASYYYIFLILVYTVLLAWYGISVGYSIWSTSGTRSWLAVYFGVISDIAKQALSNVLVLMVPLGWAVTMSKWFFHALNGTMRCCANLIDTFLNEGVPPHDLKWAITTAWELNNLLALVSIAILWKLYPSAKDYAFVMAIASVGGIVEFTINEDVEHQQETVHDNLRPTNAIEEECEEMSLSEIKQIKEKSAGFINTADQSLHNKSSGNFRSGFVYEGFIAAYSFEVVIKRSSCKAFMRDFSNKNDIQCNEDKKSFDGLSTLESLHEGTGFKDEFSKTIKGKDPGAFYKTWQHCMKHFGQLSLQKWAAVATVCFLNLGGIVTPIVIPCALSISPSLPSASTTSSCSSPPPSTDTKSIHASVFEVTPWDESNISKNSFELPGAGSGVSKIYYVLDCLNTGMPTICLETIWLTLLVTLQNSFWHLCRTRIMSLHHVGPIHSYLSNIALSFITPILQQGAKNKLSVSVSDIVRTVQVLNDKGYISSMRTDSSQLSADVNKATNLEVQSCYGDEHVRSVDDQLITQKETMKQRHSEHSTTEKAHEAIRTVIYNGRFLDQDELVRHHRQPSSAASKQLYKFIYHRTCASLMKKMVQTLSIAALSVDLSTDAVSGTVIIFNGFMSEPSPSFDNHNSVDINSIKNNYVTSFSSNNSTQTYQFKKICSTMQLLHLGSMRHLSLGS